MTQLLLLFLILKEIIHSNVKYDGRIIKWTQLVGFLTLVGMKRVVEGNHGKDLKER